MMRVEPGQGSLSVRQAGALVGSSRASVSLGPGSNVQKPVSLFGYACVVVVSPRMNYEPGSDMQMLA